MMVEIQKNSRRKTYGKTWWGQAFVEAMERDNDPRLKRGRTYANTGKVYEFKIIGSSVQAKVKGNYYPFYKVSLELKQLTEDLKARFKDLVEKYPRIGVELARGRFAPDLLELCLAKQIVLLPTSWSQILAHCNCPDYGNPCKHQAGTYYMLANEIDKDPLLLLRLRGLNPSEFFMEDAVIFHEVKKLKDLGEKLSGTLIQTKNKDLRYEGILSKVLSWKQKYPVNVIELLDKNPPFYNQGDFQFLLSRVYGSLINSAQRFKFSKIETDDKLHLENLELKFKEDSKSYLDSWSIEAKNGQIKNLELVLNLLSTKLNSRLESMSDSFRSYFLLSHFALKLCEEGFFIPEPLIINEKTFDLRFLPVIINDELLKAYKKLEELFPEGNLEEILSYFLTSIVHYCASELKDWKEDKLLNSFFSNSTFQIDHYSEGNLVYSLSNWLEKLQLRKSSLNLVIRLKELRDKFTISAALIDKPDPLSTLLDYKSLLGSSKTEFIKEAKRELNIASDYILEIRDIIDSNGNLEPEIEMTKAFRMLTESKTVLQFLGIELSVPKGLANILSPKLKAKVSSSSSAAISLLNMSDLLKFSYEIAIGDQTVSVNEFKDLIKNAKGLIKHKDQYLFLDLEEISKILSKLEKEPSQPKSNQEAIFNILSSQVDGVDLIRDSNLEKFYELISREEKTSVPKELKATLRPYQERGFKWLYSNLKKNFGACIADDMGLGKTIQVITLILKLKKEKEYKPTLIVCPTALVGNWFKECEKFAPSLRVEVYHGSKRELKEDFDLLITSYGTFKRDLKELNKTEWGLMVIDEAQNIKNTETQQTRAIKSIKAEHFISMTGTPVENRLSELWSILDYSNKGLLGSLREFKTLYAEPIERHKDEEAINRLKRITAPFLLRRLKTDKNIIKDLPEKIDSIIKSKQELANLTVSSGESWVNDLTNKELKEIFSL
jgi:uncharacterized Zn finger protein